MRPRRQTWRNTPRRVFGHATPTCLCAACRQKKRRRLPDSGRDAELSQQFSGNGRQTRQRGKMRQALSDKSGPTSQKTPERGDAAFTPQTEALSNRHRFPRIPAPAKALRLPATPRGSGSFRSRKSPGRPTRLRTPEDSGDPARRTSSRASGEPRRARFCACSQAAPQAPPADAEKTAA